MPTPEGGGQAAGTGEESLGVVRTMTGNWPRRLRVQTTTRGDARPEGRRISRQRSNAARPPDAYWCGGGGGGGDAEGAQTHRHGWRAPSP
jgi:hypothetical protein